MTLCVHQGAGGRQKVEHKLNISDCAHIRSHVKVNGTKIFIHQRVASEDYVISDARSFGEVKAHPPADLA